jgi:predicted GIY-YIG superfamily endonuclease
MALVKPFWIYILRCRDGSYYVGHTDDLLRRVAQHQGGEIAGHTRRRRPVTLVYSAEMASRDQAIRCEMRLKGWTRAKKEALIRGDWNEVKRLARGADRSARRPSTPAREGAPR